MAAGKAKGFAFAGFMCYAHAEKAIRLANGKVCFIMASLALSSAQRLMKRAIYQWLIAAAAGGGRADSGCGLGGPQGAVCSRSSRGGARCSLTSHVQDLPPCQRADA